jgi:hypothetical protein
MNKKGVMTLERQGAKQEESIQEIRAKVLVSSVLTVA